MKLTGKQYAFLYDTVFQEGYPGYNPEVQESPDGNRTFDTAKNYAHIAKKYIGDDAILKSFLREWVDHAVTIAIKLGIPQKYWPAYEDSTIRILAYPPGAGTARHADFCLFTLPMYRNFVETYEAQHGDDHSFLADDAFNRLHNGELLHEINNNYIATPHLVRPDPKGRVQYSAVFFAMPRLDVHLPSGLSVRDWLKERKERSRRNVGV